MKIVLNSQGGTPMSPTHQPKHPHLTATLILACLAQFMVILDVSVVNVALPSIKSALGFSEAGLQWVVNGYTVTFAGFLLLGGRAADLLGRRRVFVTGLALFGLSSLGGGLADSQTVLIGMRLIQGLAGAVIAPASLSILTSTFTEPRARSRAVGIWSAMGGAGGAAGVLLGGILTDALGWRWILFINVPIGLIGAFAAQQLLLESRNPNATRDFDLLGALSATIGLSLLVFGIVKTDSSGWGSAEALVPILAGLVLLAAFIVIEGRFAKAPLMPLRLFSSRSLTIANVSVFMVGAAVFPMWFFFTLYLQEVRGYSPLHAGIVFLPMTVMIVIGSQLGSKLSLRYGPKPPLIAGMLLLAAGLFLFAQLTVHGTYLGDMLLPGLLTSIGLPLTFVPGALAATAGVAPQEAGLASGVFNSARMFGGALGLAVLATLATTHSRADLRHPTAAIHTFGEALTNGFTYAFVFAALIALVGAGVAWLLMPSRVTHEEAVAPITDEAAAHVAIEV
jgi:EmrB/QacA subfamily drug resistance transporter